MKRKLFFAGAIVAVAVGAAVSLYILSLATLPERPPGPAGS